MTAFTILGLIVFWIFCFGVGHGLAAFADAEGLVMGIARLLVGTERLEKDMRAMAAYVVWMKA